MPAILELDKEALEHGFIHLKRKSEDDHIYMFDACLGNDLLHFLDYLIKHADKVKGTYTVEELELYNVSFTEILKAIKSDFLPSMN